MESVTKVIQHLEDGYGSSSALNAISVPLLKRASKEICQYVAKTDQGFRLVEDLLGALQNLLRHDGSLFQFLVGLGLIELLADIFQAVYQKLRKDGTAEGLQAVVEMLLESANVLGDLGSSAKSQVCQGLCCYMLDLLQAEQLDFQMNMEVVKSTNMLLDQCPTATKESMIKTDNFQKKIKEIVSLIRNIGDYEFQVGLVECLIRLFPRKSRQLYASQFIRDTAMLEGFLSIKDREFETDCRRFLNDLHSEIDSIKNVYSIPCLAAFVGNKQLRKPSDTGYDQFWVDFNIGSQRMTLFCEQNSLLSQGTPMDEQLWETVAIYRTDILQCSCSEIQNTVLLEIALKQRVCELYPSQHQDVTDNTVRVEFDLQRESEIAEAVGKTFCFSEIRSKVSTVVNPIHISVREVQEMDSQLEQESEEPELPYQTNMQPPASQESTARRRKVSIPSIPMRTPVSTPVVPAEQISQNSSTPAHKRNENRLSKDHKVSSTTAPLKISTKENLPATEQPRAHAEASEKQDVAYKDTGPRMGNEKKNQLVKEDLKSLPKQKEFVAPKTPVSVAKMSKPKVKTPVVTVTPPAVNKKKKKGKQHVLKNAKAEKHNEEQDMLPKNNDLDPESIPDSIPAELEVKINMVPKETAGSKNTSMDSGINMDISSVSMGNISTELKDDTNVSLPVIPENEPTESKQPDPKECSVSKLKNVSKNKDEDEEMIETNIKEKALDKHERSRNKLKTKPKKDKSNSDESHKINKKQSMSVTSKKESEPENVETRCQEKQPERTSKINKSETKAKRDKLDKDTMVSENKLQSPADVQIDDEDKFDFDSQEDKIPDSLEPSIEPNVKSKADKSTENLSKENSITDRYSKILSIKGSKEALRESIEQTAKYIEEEADARSRRNSGALTPSKAAGFVNKRNKSFTDFEPSLKELFDIEKENKEKRSGKTKLSSKEKTSKKSKKNNAESLECNESSNTHKTSKSNKEKSSNENKQEQQKTSSRRSLRKRDTNKTYKEIDESDISFVEESQVAKMVDKDNSEADKKARKVCKKEFTATKMDARVTEKDCLNISRTNQIDKFKQKFHSSEVEKQNGDQSDDQEQREDSNFSDHLEEQVNDARSDASSDISEDYRFNNSQASQDLSQDIEIDAYVQSVTKDNTSANRLTEQVGTEDCETWSKIANLSLKNQTKGIINKEKQPKNKKTKDNGKEKRNINKHESDSDSNGDVLAESIESEFDNTTQPQKKERKRKNLKNQCKKGNLDIILVSNVNEVDDSYQNKEKDERFEKSMFDEEDQRIQEKRDKSKSIVYAQKREKMKFEEGASDGHFKYSQMDAMSKKKGKGFVFQMSYCRSETNYKYNRSMPGINTSKFSKGYDPYDFAACENESVMSEGESQNLEGKNGGEHSFKPRKFFKHSRKDKDQTADRDTKTNCSSNRNNSEDNSDAQNSSFTPPDLNDSLVMSLTSPTVHKARSKNKQDKKPSKPRSRKQLVEKVTVDTTMKVDLSENSPADDRTKQTKSKAQHKTKSKQKDKERNKTKKNKSEEVVDSTADSESSLVCSPNSSKVNIQKSNRRLKENKQALKVKCMESDQSSNSVMESDSSLIVSPDASKAGARRSRKSAVNDSSLGENSLQFKENNMSSRRPDRHSSGKNKKLNRSKSENVAVERKEHAESPIEINSDDDNDLENYQNHSKSERLMEQDPVTKKWYRKSDLIKVSDESNHKHRKDEKKKRKKGGSPGLNEMKCTAEPLAIENDGMLDQEEENCFSKLVMIASRTSDERNHSHRKNQKKQEKEGNSPELREMEEGNADLLAVENDGVSEQEEENCFSRIVKDIVSSRGETKKGVKNDKKMSRKHKNPAENSLEDNSRNVTDSSFKEFDSEIVDCFMQDVKETPCVSASLASTPKFGSASRKRYNPLDVSVIKTPVSLTKSVTFGDDVEENESDKENVPKDKTNERKPSRSRRRNKSVQYKDLSDEDIERDERLSQSSSRRSISSILDSSNNISTRSEKSWILERKQTPKPKPKTYKSRNKEPSRYNSQTESSDDGNEDDNKSIASRSLSGRTGTLSLDMLTPSLSSLYREARGEVEDENLILTPVTPLKLTSSQHKSEDDIEVYQTQENCTVSLNMDKKPAKVEDMDVGEIGNICLSALGVKTPQKYNQEEDDDRVDIGKWSRKKLKKNIKSFLGDSGFASGPSSEVRPSRSALKRKYPNLVECESGLSDEEQVDETEKSILVPKKLFKFDHSSILQTVKEEQSDTASTCSDTMEDQQQLDFPVQSGLSSFLAAFGADVKKHLNAKKQKFEALTKTAMKSTHKQFTSVWMEQQQYQSGVTDDFQARMMVELTQLESDIIKMREAEGKSEEFFKSQLEVLHTNFQSQRTRLDNFKKLYSSYVDRARKVQIYNTTTHKNMMEQLRKEMNILQKKLIEETQKQELLNVRRGLQNLF